MPHENVEGRFTDEIQIPFNIRALQEAGVTSEQWVEWLKFILGVFGSRWQQVLPNQFLAVQDVRYLEQLVPIVKAVHELDGFDRCISRFTMQTLAHSSYVAWLAHAATPRVDRIQLEPDVAENGQADLLLTKGTERLWIEAKTFDARGQGPVQEHQELFRKLRRATKAQCNVHVQYDAPPTTDEFDAMVTRITEALSHTTNAGLVHSEKGLRIEFRKPDGLAPKRKELNIEPMGIWGVEHSMDQNTRRPMSLFGYQETQLVVSGPLPDFTKQIHNKLSRAIDQAPRNGAFVLALDAEGMLGSMENHVHAVAAEFARTRNKVVSGVLLTSGLHGKGQRLVRLFRNPYAAVPVEDIWEELFRTIEKPTLEASL